MDILKKFIPEEWIWICIVNILANTVLIVLMNIQAKRDDASMYGMTICSLGIGFMVGGVMITLGEGQSLRTLVNPPMKLLEGVIGGVFVSVAMVYTLFLAMGKAPNPFFPIVFSHIAAPLSLLAMMGIGICFPSFARYFEKVERHHFIGSLIILGGLAIFKGIGSEFFNTEFPLKKIQASVLGWIQ